MRAPAYTAARRSAGAARRLLLAGVLALALVPLAASAQVRVRDLTTRPGDVPRRLVGYGLVVGLDGTGDRNFGGTNNATPSVRSVLNLLRKFDIDVPADRLRLRNVAAVLVTAEVSPWLRAGGRFDVQVSALDDATSLRGGTLWITPLVTDPDAPPVATAQGSVGVPADDGTRSAFWRRGNAGRVTDGGALETDLPAPPLAKRLLLKQPDLVTAGRIADAINTKLGANTAKAEDPGAVALMPPGNSSDNLMQFLAEVDTLPVVTAPVARIVIDAREGTVVAGGGILVGAAVVSHHGITLQIGGVPVSASAAPAGLVHVEPEAKVEDVAAGLHAAGARPDEIAAIFDALRTAGAIAAEVTIR